MILYLSQLMLSGKNMWWRWICQERANAYKSSLGSGYGTWIFFKAYRIFGEVSATASLYFLKLSPYSLLISNHLPFPSVINRFRLLISQWTILFWWAWSRVSTRFLMSVCFSLNILRLLPIGVKIKALCWLKEHWVCVTLANSDG